MADKSNALRLLRFYATRLAKVQLVVKDALHVLTIHPISRYS